MSHNIAKSDTEESIVKATGNGDLCLICTNVLRILVVPNRSCECRQRVCLHCFRDYLGLNNSPDSRNSGLAQCLLRCGRKLRGNPPYTVADIVDLSKLDLAYGTISCPRDCGWIGTRCDFQKTHKNQCANIVLPCKFCNTLLKRHNHTVECANCHMMIVHCQQSYHKCDKESETF